MGFGSKILVVGTTGFVVNQLRKNVKKQEKKNNRENIPCQFTKRLTEEEFEELAFRTVKRINKKRINIEVYGAKVYGTVTSQSGLTEWDFTIDFNDYGSVTGTYWLWAENEDSLIPENIAEEMQAKIEDLLCDRDDCEYDDVYERDDEPDILESNNNYYYQREDFEKNEEIQRLKKQNQILENENKKFKNERRKERFKKFWKSLLITIVVFVVCGFVFYKITEYKKLIPVGMSSVEMKGLHYEDVANKLKTAGFLNVQLEALDDLKIEDEKQEGLVEQVVIDNAHTFDETKKFSYEDEVVIRYHTIKEIYSPISSEDAVGKNYKDIVKKFEKAGFVNVKSKPIYDLVTGWLKSDGEVEEVIVDGDNDVTTYSSFRPDAEVIIKYHAFKKNKK